MVHRGELLKAAIGQSGIPVTKVAGAIGKSRRWLYLQFERPDVSIDTLLLVGKVIHHDFSGALPELAFKARESRLVHDRGLSYPENDAEFWKNKYLRLLEEYTALLKKIG